MTYSKPSAVLVGAVVIATLCGALIVTSSQATAETVSLEFNQTAYTETGTVQVTLTDPALPSDESILLNIESTTEGQTPVFDEPVPRNVNRYTTASVASDGNADRQLTQTDFVYSNNEGISITDVTRNPDGTATLEFSGTPSSEFGLTYFSSETILMDHVQGSSFSGTIQLSPVDSNGALAVVDGETITVSYSSPSGDSSTQEVGVDNTLSTRLRTTSGLAITFTGYRNTPEVDRTNESLSIDNQSFQSSGQVSATISKTDVDNPAFTNLTNLNVTANQLSINRTQEPLSEVRVSGDIIGVNVSSIGFDDKLDIVTRASSIDNQLQIQTNASALLVETTTQQIVSESFVDGGGFVSFSVPAGTSRLKLKRGPEKIFVRPVNQPRTVLSGANVTVEFYEQDGDIVRSRTGQQDGSVSTFGLPLDVRYIAQASQRGFIERRAPISSVREQNNVYLLSENATSHQIRFRIVDLTGQFGPGSVLKVERALNVSTSVDSQLIYQAVAGERLSRGGGYETFLEDGIRYRVTVIGEDGEDTRQLGVFVPRSDRLIDLEIGTLDYSFDEDTEDGTLITNLADEETLTVAYRDESNATSVLRGAIHERGNVSNQLTTFAAPSSAVPLGTFTFAVDIGAAGGDNETAYVANATIIRDGVRQEVVKPFGASQYPIGLPLDEGWQQITGVGFLVVLAGAFSVANARIGAIILPGVALLMWMIGFLDGVVTLGAIALALTIAVGYSWAVSSKEVLAR